MRADGTARPPRGRPRRAGARKAIVDATLTLLAERGFPGTTIEAIAGRAGVGRNTIYRRWPTKEELLADALRELTAELGVQEGDDLYSVLVAWVRDFTDLFADPLFSRILPAVLGELQRNPDFARLYADRVVRPRRQAIVEQGIDVDQVADVLAGAPFLRLLPLGLPPVGERYAAELLATIWNGIKP